MSKQIESEIESYFDRLWPINRCVMGPGYRESMTILKELVEFHDLNFPTGSKVFDWTIPKEWSVTEAYLKGPDGKRYADFSVNNLHLVSYSTALHQTMPLSELKERIHTLPELPNAIPFVTSVYKEYWGFCLDHETFMSLPDGDYEVVIDSKHEAGNLLVGEAVLSGTSGDEILFSSYLCHPSMANNELSGPLVLAFLYRFIASLENRKYTYRFVLCPETIGAIAYLSERGKHLKQTLKAGFQLTCLGDSGPFTYKRSRRGDCLSDRIATLVLREYENSQVTSFVPTGSDERQYCSPGFNLPVGSLMRTRYDQYKEYHTSLDNKDFINFAALAGSVEFFKKIVVGLEENLCWYSKAPFGEPQLGKRELYPTLSKYSAFHNTLEDVQEAMFWLLNLSDGMHDVIDIAERSGCSIASVCQAAEVLEKADLLTKKEMDYDEMLD